MNKITPQIAAQNFAATKIAMGFELVSLHEYQDINKVSLYWRIRLKHPKTGAKIIWPMHLDQHGHFILKEPPFSGKKPLYCLPTLNKSENNPIYIVEGEKCVDTLKELGLTATTSGGNTSAGSTNWSPLSNHEVIIWPDNDKEGICYADEVAQQLLSLNCRISLVDINKLNLQEKEDVVDWLKSNPHATRKDIQQLPLKPILSSTNNAPKTDDEILATLAQLSDIHYQRQRKQAAKMLKISVSLLDKLVKQLRVESGDNTENIFPKIEPWDEPVALNSLLNELVNTLNRFLVFASVHEARAIALWIIHTHCIDAANISPILNISSPEKRCGKSTLLAVLRRLVNRPLIASNISAAAIFRSIEKWAPTLLIDEGDSFMKENEELRGIINSGHTRDLAYTLRCVGEKHEPTRFCTWGAKVIAGIGHLADTIEDRSVLIQLRRKLQHEKRDQLRDVPQLLFDGLVRKSVRFTLDNADILAESKPSIPQELNDRAADNWQPLLAIADLGGEEWIKQARDAALGLSCLEASGSISIELLQDIKEVFESKRIERIWTAELLPALYLLSEAPWATYNHGKSLTDRQLANKLGDFGIRSKDLRFAGKIRKGYELPDFEDTFKRYLTQPQEKG